MVALDVGVLLCSTLDCVLVKWTILKLIVRATKHTFLSVRGSMVALDIGELL
jgi:hypothetical protein